MYLIVCPQAHLDTKGWPVCVPIGTKSHSSLFHAELKAGEGGVAHDSFAWCNEIFTLDPGHFRTKMGEAPAHVQVDVKDALRDFFDFT
jgi:mRNA-degrading endonuclease toxin of MazEF toxin-antitoxin module